MTSPDIDNLTPAELTRVSRRVNTQPQHLVFTERLRGSSWTTLEVLTGKSPSTLRGHERAARRNIITALATGVLEQVGADDE